jgi:hypothetical protein
LIFLITNNSAEATNITINQVIRGVGAVAEALDFSDDSGPEEFKENSGDTNNTIGEWSKSVTATAYYDRNVLDFGDFVSIASAEAEQSSNITLNGSMMVTGSGSAYKTTFSLGMPSAFTDHPYSYSRSSLLLSFSIDGPANYDFNSQVWSYLDNDKQLWPDGFFAKLIMDDTVIFDYDYWNIEENMQPLIAGDYTLYYWIEPEDDQRVTDYDFNFNVYSTPVPEPATILLIGTGLVGLAARGRKRLLKK